MPFGIGFQRHWGHRRFLVRALHCRHVFRGCGVDGLHAMRRRDGERLGWGEFSFSLYGMLAWELRGRAGDGCVRPVCCWQV